jgi:hypothetical protein
MRRLILLPPSAETRKAPQDIMSDASDHQGSSDTEQELAENQESNSNTGSAAEESDDPLSLPTPPKGNRNKTSGGLKTGPRTRQKPTPAKSKAKAPAKSKKRAPKVPADHPDEPAKS